MVWIVVSPVKLVAEGSTVDEDEVVSPATTSTKCSSASTAPAVALGYRSVVPVNVGLVSKLLELLNEVSVTSGSETDELDGSSAELDAAMGVRRLSMLLMSEDESGNGVTELSVSLKSVIVGFRAFAMDDDSVCEGPMSVSDEAEVSGFIESV